MSTAAPIPRDTMPSPGRSRCLRVLLLLLVILLSCAWMARAPLLRASARLALPALARSAGYELGFDVLESRLPGPLVLGNVRLRDAHGSDLRASQLELDLAPVSELLTHPRRIFRRISVHGVAGTWRRPSAVACGASSPAADRGHFFAPAWPLIIEAGVKNVCLAVDAGHLRLKDAELILSGERPGIFRAGSATISVGDRSVNFSGLGGTTAWRDGVAYLADMALDDDAVIELLSVALDGPEALSLRAHSFGGGLYAEWAAGGERTRAALSASDISLDSLGRFLGLESPLRGRVGLLKLTFSGDPSAPLDAQISLRAEADDVSGGGRAFRTLRVGASLSGRRLKIDEFRLGQAANAVDVRGLLAVPSSDWRASEVRLDIAATARDAHALAALAGPPWDKISGGFDLGAAISGTLGEPSGWLKARGWQLRLPGLPPGTVQADAVFRDGSAKITCLESHSGRNFLRGSGEISLKEALSYRGRMEVRIRELARYLQPLGSLAPDWAREGGVMVFWDGDGSGDTHSGVLSLELFHFTGNLNPIPVNGKLAATYSPGNVYVSKFLLDRGPLSLSASGVLSDAGLSMRDIELFNGRRRLLQGEVFLPVSYPRLLEGNAWSQVMVPGKDVRANIRSDDLQLGALANLFGQSAVFEGRVDWRLDASGPWENPVFTSAMTIEKFRAGFDNFAIPSSRLEAGATLAKQRLDLSVRLDTGAKRPVSFVASVPILGRNDAGGFRLLDRSQPANARLELPTLDLAKFSGKRPMSGQLGGSVGLSGRLGEPRFDGALQWDKVRFSPVEGLAPVDNFAGRLVFSGSGAEYEGAGGRMGDGSFTLAGGFGFADLLRATCSSKVSGKQLQLVDAGKFRFAGDVELSLGLKDGAGSVAGDIALTAGRADVSLAATTFLLPLDGSFEPSPVAVPFRIAGALAGADASIRVHTRQPVLLAGGAKASADVRLGGKTEALVPVGRIDVEGLRADLPSVPLNFSRARFSFVSEMPRVPVLDLAGTAQAGAYRVTATAWGPLGRQQIKLESVPELSPQQIALLLGAGIAPDLNSAAGDFAVDIEPPRAEELPPSAIGYSWELR